MTQHKIEEFYENNSDDSQEENSKLAVERVKKIFQTTNEGCILLFSTTQAEIHKLVEELNKTIPNNCIALPYYGKLDPKYKAISKEGKKEMKKITIDRSDILKVFTKEIKQNEAKKVNIKTYNRGCIIATNAAKSIINN